MTNEYKASQYIFLRYCTPFHEYGNAAKPLEYSLYHVIARYIYIFVSSLLQVGSYSYDMTKMLFRVSKLTFIQKQSIILDYSIEIRNLREKDKIFLAGALGNYSLAGFEMVRILQCFPTSFSQDSKIKFTFLTSKFSQNSHF